MLCSFDTDKLYNCSRGQEMHCSFDTAELGFSIQSNETLTVTDKIHLIRTPKFLDITSTIYKILTMRFNMDSLTKKSFTTLM